MEEFGNSPWSVNCLEDFLFYCCPECDNREHSREFFLQHAFEHHPDAKEILSLLIGVNIKPEIPEFIDYDNPIEESNNANFDQNLKYEQPIDYKNDLNLLQCPKPNCFYQAKSNSGLIYHLNYHKDCQYCGKSFSGDNASRKFKQHIKQHNKPKTLCDNCGKDFKFASKLKTHKTSCLKSSDQNKEEKLLEI